MAHTMWKRMGMAATCAALMLSAAPVGAVTFKPFTTVEDVCPSCPKRASDEITLSNNKVVRAKVVAENEDFFVLSRYGEIRALPKTQVQSVEWANDSAPMGLSSQDQVVLKSGHVLTGSITEEKEKPAYVQLQSSVNKQTYAVFQSEIEAVCKAGSKM